MMAGLSGCATQLSQVPVRYQSRAEAQRAEANPLLEISRERRLFKSEYDCLVRLANANELNSVWLINHLIATSEQIVISGGYVISLDLRDVKQVRDIKYVIGLQKLEWLGLSGTRVPESDKEYSEKLAAVVDD